MNPPLKTMKTAYLALVVGTSLINNVVKGTRLDLSKYPVINKFVDKMKSALTGDKSADSLLNRLAINSELLNTLTEIVCSEPRAFSAELNTAIGLRDYVGHSITVELFSTDTGATMLSANAIAKCLGKGHIHGIDIAGLVRIRFFGSSIHDGLANLMDTMGRKLIENSRKGLTTFVGITSGLKLEIATASLIAWLLNAQPVYAMDSGELILLPRIPIKLDDWVMGVLKWVGDGVPESSIYSDELETLRALELMGLVSRERGYFKVRTWVKHLLELTTANQRGQS